MVNFLFGFVCGMVVAMCFFKSYYRATQKYEMGQVMKKFKDHCAEQRAKGERVDV